MRVVICWLCCAAAGVVPQPALADALHDSAGCANEPTVDATGTLSIEPQPPFVASVVWEPDVYGTEDPRPFLVSISTQQRAGCPYSLDARYTTYLPDGVAERSQMLLPTAGTQRLRVSRSSVVFVYDHPGILDGRLATQLEVEGGSLDLHTSVSWSTARAGMDPTGVLALVAVGPRSLDASGDGIADIVLAGSGDTRVGITGTPRDDTVDLTLLDPAICVSAMLDRGNDRWTAPQTASVASCEGTEVDLGAGDDVAMGGPNDDRVCDRAGGVLAVLGAGDDRFRCHGEDSSLSGAAPDTPLGTRRIVAGAGDDEVLSRWGQNTVLGGDGDDRITTGRHRDIIAGGRGSDTLDGDAGHDRIFGGPGNDALLDEIWMGHLHPTLRGNDLLVGGTGNDAIAGGFGNDRMFGGPGRDSLRMRGGAPRMVGGPGADIINAYHNRPVVLGGAGRDYIEVSRMMGGYVDAGSGVDVVWQNGTGGRRRGVLSCGSGIDWLYSAPVPVRSCERQYFCFAHAPRRRCGRLLWPARVSIDDLEPNTSGIGPD